LVTDCKTSVPNTSTRLSHHITWSRNKSSSYQKPTNRCITALIINETWTTAWAWQETFCVPDSDPETTESRRGTFCVLDSDLKTTESEPEYKDAEEGPSRARTHISSSSPEPRQVEGLLEEPNRPEPEWVGQPLVEWTDQRKSPFDTNESEPNTNEDLSASFSVKGWNPFEPRFEPFNPFHLPLSPTPLPLPPTPKPMATDVTMNNNDSKIKEVKLNPPVTISLPYFSLPYSLSILNSANLLFLSPPVELLFYIYLFHQNFLIHMPSFYFLHSLVHSLLNFLFDKHSLKAMHLFTIRYFQVGYLSPSLDLNVL
jgi:hypothetical protein